MIVFQVKLSMHVIDNFVYSLNDCICLWVVTCSWFDFNAIIVTHLFELKFEFAPIVKDNNKLKLQEMCKPGFMKQILDGCC
jgi:hypothetical protein